MLGVYVFLEFYRKIFEWTCYSSYISLHLLIGNHAHKYNKYENYAVSYEVWISGILCIEFNRDDENFGGIF